MRRAARPRPQLPPQLSAASDADMPLWPQGHGKAGRAMTRQPGDLPELHPFRARAALRRRQNRSGEITVCGESPKDIGNRSWPVRAEGDKDMNARRYLLVTAAIALPVAALAQDGTVLLPPVVISGGLSPIDADAYGRDYTIVTADEIETRGIQTLRDALRGVPGVSVVGSGDSYTQVRIRGAEANHTLVLIDGIRASAGDGEYIMTGLDTANIDRIEVLRGPQSAFYGSDASAGVVNIITRQAQPGRHAGLKAEYGNGHAINGYVTMRNERGGFSLSAGRLYDKGYDYSGDKGGDDDGIRRDTVTLTGDWQATEALRLGLIARKSWERYEYDDTFWDPNGAPAPDGDAYVIDADYVSKRHESLGGLWAEYEMLDGRLTHRLEANHTRFDQSYGGAFAKARTTEYKYRATVGLDGTVDDAAQTFGLELSERRDSNSSAASNERKNTSYAIEYRGELNDGLDVQLGVRRDNNTTFPDATSWSAGLSYVVPGTGLRIHSSAGKGIVNPNYTELFGGWGTVGNPDLRPESNKGWDFGVETAFLGGRGLVDVTVFREWIKDQIVWSGIPLPDGSNYRNAAGTSPREGIEIAGSVKATPDLTFGLAYTYLDARDPTGARSTHRPRHHLDLTAGYDYGRGTVSGGIRYVAGDVQQQPYGTFARRTLPDYWLVDVAGSYDLNDRVRLTGRIDNLLDEDYQEVWGYATPGRTAWLGVEARW